MPGIPEEENGVLATCAEALSLAPESLLPPLPPSPELLGAPAWYPFETSAWTLGENIRQCLLQRPRLKSRATVLQAIAEVALCERLRRGRQPFVGLLGFRGAAQYASRLLPLLADEDVDGHALSVLLRMRAVGYQDEVRHLLVSDRAWVRRIARRYCSHAATTPQPN
jgi:hypothetical protein